MNNYMSGTKEDTKNPIKASVDLNTVTVLEKQRTHKKQPKHILLSAEIELKMV